MKKLKLLSFLLIFSHMVFATAESEDLYDANESPSSSIDVGRSEYKFLAGRGGNVLFDNGPIITSVGTGVGGADESVLQDTSLGMRVLGLVSSVDLGFRLSDQFTVTADSWDISTITFFAFSSVAPASAITAVNLRIWDGAPGAVGSNVVFGDDITNRMSSTQVANILRVREVNIGIDNSNQIVTSVVDVNTTLSAGTYWLDWQHDGPSAPVVPPITITGQTSTGDALRFFETNWIDVLDTGTNTPLGLPFVIEGSAGVSGEPVSVPMTKKWSLLLMGLLLMIVTISYRRYFK